MTSSVHRFLNLLLLVGIVVQFWAAGWAAFGQPFTIHAALGWSLIPVALLSLVAAAVAHGRRRAAWAALLLVLLVLQPVFVFVVSSASIALAALHPVNGLAAFCVALHLHRRPVADREPRTDEVSPALATVGLLACVACAGPGAADTASNAWTLQEEVRIGSLMGDAATTFGTIADLLPHPDGGVYVLDSQAAAVRLFAADGTLRLTAGGPGEGPGEFLQPAVVGGGSEGGVRVVDMRSSRITEFDGAGGLVRTDPLPGGAAIFPWPGQLLLDGGLVTPLLRRMEGSIPRLDLLRLDSDFRPIDTLSAPVFPGESEAGVFELSTDRGRTTVRVPYSPGIAWTIDPGGAFWVAPTTAEYRIHRIDFSGDTLLTISRPHEPIPVSEAEIDSAIAGLRWFTRQGGEIDRSRFPPTRPALTGLFVAGNGWLAVEATTSAFGSGWNAPARVLDVFDQDGRYLGRLELPDEVRTFPARPVFVGDTVYAVAVDELDVSYVVRYRLLSAQERTE